MELTKEYLDKKLAASQEYFDKALDKALRGFVTTSQLEIALAKQSKDLKEYVDARLDARLGTQTKELKLHAEEQTEELARMIETGFAHIEELLDVKEKVQQLLVFEASAQSKFHKLEEALHVTL